MEYLKFLSFGLSLFLYLHIQAKPINPLFQSNKIQDEKDIRESRPGTNNQKSHSCQKKMDWVRIRQNNEDFFPVCKHKNQSFEHGVIFLKKKEAFDIYFKFSGSQIQKGVGFIKTDNPIKI